MRDDLFERRLAKVRHRFATTLESKIKDDLQAVEHMTGPEGSEHVCTAYLHLHEICALGSTVGFPATGKAARAAEIILLESHLSNRALTTTEHATFRKALDALWAAAQTELQFMYSRGG
jgi:hypothetical protein